MRATGRGGKLCPRATRPGRVPHKVHSTLPRTHPLSHAPRAASEFFRWRARARAKEARENRRFPSGSPDTDATSRKRQRWLAHCSRKGCSPAPHKRSKRKQNPVCLEQPRSSWRWVVGFRNGVGPRIYSLPGTAGAWERRRLTPGRYSLWCAPLFGNFRFHSGLAGETFQAAKILNSERVSGILRNSASVQAG